MLTPQQQEIVQLAARGYTNREIVARLQLSPRTISRPSEARAQKSGGRGVDLRGWPFDALPGAARPQRTCRGGR